MYIYFAPTDYFVGKIKAQTVSISFKFRAIYCQNYIVYIDTLLSSSLVVKLVMKPSYMRRYKNVRVK